MKKIIFSFILVVAVINYSFSQTWWDVLEDATELVIDIANDNNSSSTQTSTANYYEQLVANYGSAEMVRENYLPSKAELYQYLQKFYIDENGSPISMNGSSEIHKNRNKYNKGPKSKYDFTKYSGRTYKDKNGNLWSKGIYDNHVSDYHGDNYTFRGESSSNKGCQVCYFSTEGDNYAEMDDETSKMGTFDFGYFYDGSFSKHDAWDIDPHNENGNYNTGLTTIY